MVFTLVWIAWLNGSLHHELHGREDDRARSTFLLQILLLAAMGAFIPEADGPRGAAFAIASGLLFAVLTMLWLLAARRDPPEYRRSAEAIRHRDGCRRHPAEPLARTCAGIAVACLALGAARPAPLVLGLALVLLLSIPSGLAVAHRTAGDSPRVGDGRSP